MILTCSVHSLVEFILIPATKDSHCGTRKSGSGKCMEILEVCIGMA